MDHHTQHSQNYWGTKYAMLFKRALNTKKQVNGSTHDSRTAAPLQILQISHKIRKSKERLKKTQQRLKKDISTSTHTDIKSCKKGVQVPYKRAELWQALNHRFVHKCGCNMKNKKVNVTI